MSTPLPRPTVELVTAIGHMFDCDFASKLADDSLTELFEAFPNNTSLSHIMLKVVAVNSLYATNVALSAGNTKRLATMAQHIHGLNLDRHLDNNDLRSVDLVAQITINSRQSNFYSFASKYCSWQKQSIFPIYDRRARTHLQQYKKQDSFSTFSTNDLWCYNGYEAYHNIVAAFQAYYRLDSLSFKQIDKFLYWLDPSDSNQHPLLQMPGTDGRCTKNGKYNGD